MVRRAFTLIEVMVALTLGVVVLGTAVNLAVAAGQDHDASRRRAHLARTASFLNRTLANDLRHAGLGMPTGPFHGTFSSGGTGRFNAPVLIGTTDSIGIVGDLPRPDADGAPFGSLASMPGGTGTGGSANAARFWWLNDNTGTCIPRKPSASVGCRLSTTSRLAAGAGDCNAAGKGGDASCPWGLRRLVAEEYFVVIAGDGSWALAQMPAQTGIANALVEAPDGQHLLFQSASAINGDWDPLKWPNANPQLDPPVALRGQGYVSSPDRVFFFKQGNTIQRVQCSGVPDPDNAAFPSANVQTMPAVAALAYTPPGGRPTTTCIGPELLADHVQSLSLSYSDKNGATLTLPLDAARKREVRAIRWRVVFEDKRFGRATVAETLEGTIALRNLQ